jgi:hypothetical protein
MCWRRTVTRPDACCARLPGESIQTFDGRFGEDTRTFNLAEWVAKAHKAGDVPVGGTGGHRPGGPGVMLA